MKLKKKTLPSSRATLADNLRRAILEWGGTYYELGKKAGVDRATIGRFVSGQTDLKLNTASAIAAALGLKLVETGRTVGGRRKPTEFVAHDQIEHDGGSA